MKNVKILVPIDFSDLSIFALKAASLIARRFEGVVTPFHAYIPVTDLDGFYYVGSGITPHEKYSEIELVLKERLNEISEQHVEPEFLATPLLDVGNPSRAITHNASRFDLVVMSTHGRTGFSRFVMGSVTEKVLRMCNKPMITVTEQSDLGDLTSFLVTTDFSENSFRVFPFANRFAELTGGTIDLVHIISDDQNFDSDAGEQQAKKSEKDLEELADSHFRNIRKQIRHRVISGNRSPYIEIQQIAEKKEYHIVFLSSVGRTGIEYLMMGSTASQVVRTVKNAVFTINPQGISPEKAKKLHMQGRDI